VWPLHELTLEFISNITLVNNLYGALPNCYICSTLKLVMDLVPLKDLMAVNVSEIVEQHLDDLYHAYIPDRRCTWHNSLPQCTEVEENKDLSTDHARKSGWVGERAQHLWQDLGIMQGLEVVDLGPRQDGAAADSGCVSLCVYVCVCARAWLWQDCVALQLMQGVFIVCVCLPGWCCGCFWICLIACLNCTIKV